MSSSRRSSGPLKRLAFAPHHRPLRYLLLATAAAVALFVYVIPREDWPGLFPSNREASSERDAAPAVSYHAPRIPLSLQAILDSLAAEHAKVHRAHHDTEPPKPIYANPWLTRQQQSRYAHLCRPQLPAAALRKAKVDGTTLSPKFMFTTITRNIADQVPDLLATIAVLVYFLGPDHVSFSILEGPSGDATPLMLDQVLVPTLRTLGVPDSNVHIVTNSPKIDFAAVNRIEALANLRNDALEPLWKDSDTGYLSRTPPGKRRTVGTDVVAVVFFNDVFLRPVDILELLHQHVAASRNTAGTGITAAWDWMERSPAYFYDVWVARTIDTGDLFYPIPNPWWSPSDSLLPTSPRSKKAYEQLQPFQAYSAWNGIAVLAPQPFLAPMNVRFRRGAKTECAASECTLIAADFWKYNWGRVQVVPAVQVAYTRKVAVETAEALRLSQDSLGWREGVPPQKFDRVVRWRTEPPEKVRCHPWPEIKGLDANVWNSTEWVAPYVL